jgi:hypothetical protein
VGAFVLVYGIWTNSVPTKMAAYYVFVVSAAGAGIAYLTGEGAEEAVEDMQGVSEAIIGQHEDFALFALISLIVLGVASLIAAYLTSRLSTFSKTAAVITLLISLLSFGLIARTGYLGGQIRHTEIRSSASNSGGAEQDDD